MSNDDLTVKVLVEIRDEIRQTNRRLDGVDMRLDQQGQRIVESEIRTATAITELHGTMRDIHGLLVEQLDLRGRVERCERDIDELKKRVN